MTSPPPLCASVCAAGALHMICFHDLCIWSKWPPLPFEKSIFIAVYYYLFMFTAWLLGLLHWLRLPLFSASMQAYT